MQIKSISYPMTPEEIVESNRQQWKGQKLTRTSDHYPKTRAEHAVTRGVVYVMRVKRMYDTEQANKKLEQEMGLVLNPSNCKNWTDATGDVQRVVFVKAKGKSTRKLERRIQKEA